MAPHPLYALSHPRIGESATDPLAQAYRDKMAKGDSNDPDVMALRREMAKQAHGTTSGSSPSTRTLLIAGGLGIAGIVAMVALK